VRASRKRQVFVALVGISVLNLLFLGFGCGDGDNGGGYVGGGGGYVGGGGGYPTLTYERVEAEDFNTDNNWNLAGLELVITQEDYTQEDIDNGQADYRDGGIDGIPELMKLLQQPIWQNLGDNHDFGISDSVYCDFTDAGNVFGDPDISIGPQDWENYTTINFYMALDNWEKVSGSKKTLKKSYFQVWLYDTGGNTLTFDLSADVNPIYPNNDWVAEPGKVRWKLVRISPQLIDALPNFDSRNVTRIEFYYENIMVSWYINDNDREWIGYDKNDTTGYGSDGYYYYMKFNGTGYDKYPVRFKPPDANGRRRLYYTDSFGNSYYIYWNWDPSTPIIDNMYFKDTLNAEKSALDSVLKVDRIEVPGKP